MAREHVSVVIAMNRSSRCAAHPHDVASVAFGDNGRAAAGVVSRCIFQVHASQCDVILHKVDMYVIRWVSLHVNAQQIDAVPGTDERAGGSVVVIAGVRQNLVK